jgi:hypothetical protein
MSDGIAPGSGHSTFRDVVRNKRTEFNSLYPCPGLFQRGGGAGIFGSNTMHAVRDGGTEPGNHLILVYKTCFWRHGLPFFWRFGYLKNPCLWWWRKGRGISVGLIRYLVIIPANWGKLAGGVFDCGACKPRPVRHHPHIMGETRTNSPSAAQRQCDMKLYSRLLGWIGILTKSCVLPQVSLAANLGIERGNGTIIVYKSFRALLCVLALCGVGRGSPNSCESLSARLRERFGRDQNG